MIYAKPREILKGFTLAWTVACLLFFGATLTGCPTTAVQRQALSAQVIARTFNRALPVWISIYEEDGARAVRSATSFEEGQLLLRDVDRRWQIVSDAWEGARHAHLFWRAEIQRCQRMGVDGGTCEVDMRHAEQNLLSRINTYRCALRSIGRSWVDDLPGVAVCTQDGGV